MGDPYSTHLPILEGLCRLISPGRILEFGAGQYSTTFFLSQPIDELVSIEIDSEWRERIANAHDDPRLMIQGGPVLLPPLTDFDLVLIDDGKAADERDRTIRYVLSQPHPPVVIHDAEVPKYRQAIHECSPKRSMLFCIETPHTALIWPEGWEQDRHELAMEVSRCAS
jgi:predicted O-methyltransferase YrrM